jgi:hypothetical protein
MHSIDLGCLLILGLHWIIRYGCLPCSVFWFRSFPMQLRDQLFPLFVDAEKGKGPAEDGGAALGPSLQAGQYSFEGAPVLAAAAAATAIKVVGAPSLQPLAPVAAVGGGKDLPSLVKVSTPSGPAAAPGSPAAARGACWAAAPKASNGCNSGGTAAEQLKGSVPPHTFPPAADSSCYPALPTSKASCSSGSVPPHTSPAADSNSYPALPSSSKVACSSGGSFGKGPSPSSHSCPAMKGTLPAAPSDPPRSVAKQQGQQTSLVLELDEAGSVSG